MTSSKATRKRCTNLFLFIIPGSSLIRRVPHDYHYCCTSWRLRALERGTLCCCCCRWDLQIVGCGEFRKSFSVCCSFCGLPHTQLQTQRMQAMIYVWRRSRMKRKENVQIDILVEISGKNALLCAGHASRAAHCLHENFGWSFQERRVDAEHLPTKYGCALAIDGYDGRVCVAARSDEHISIRIPNQQVSPEMQ